MRFPLLIFIVVPFIEIMLLLNVSEQIGALYTIGLVLFTAVLGLNLLKRQGFNTLLRFQERLRSGEIPAQEIVEGMMIAFAGAMLLTPGFLTDTIGFSLLLPPVRRRIAQRVLSSGNVMFMGSGYNSRSGFQYRDSRSDDGKTFDGEFRNESDTKPSLDERDKH